MSFVQKLEGERPAFDTELQEAKAASHRLARDIEVLAGSADASVPSLPMPVRSAADLLRGGWPEPFWYVASARSVQVLADAGWKTARGIPAGDGREDLVIARVVPPAR